MDRSRIVEPKTPSRGILREVLPPFLTSRLLLIAIFAYARIFPFKGEVKASRLTAERFLTVWSNWDSGWYLEIALNGYWPGPVTGQNTIAFFPLYPALIKGLMALLPTALRSEFTATAVGVLLSNLFAVGALAVLYLDVRERTGDVRLAQRSILYLLAFPTAFFLSCLYTESLFLLLAVGSFHFAWRRRWALAGLAGALAAMTRPPGLLLAVPLGWIYLESVGWSVRRIRLDLLFLTLIPLGFAAYLGYAWHLTGDPLAPLHVQSAWHRSLAFPWTTLFSSSRPNSSTEIDSLITVLIIGLGAVLLRKASTRAEGVYVLLGVASFVFSGNVTSASRILLMAFPAFVLLARWGENQTFDRIYLANSIAQQAVFMAAWSQHYWVA